MEWRRPQPSLAPSSQFFMPFSIPHLAFLTSASLRPSRTHAHALFQRRSNCFSVFLQRQRRTLFLPLPVLPVLLVFSFIRLLSRPTCSFIKNAPLGLGAVVLPLQPLPHH